MKTGKHSQCSPAPQQANLQSPRTTCGSPSTSHCISFTSPSPVNGNVHRNSNVCCRSGVSATDPQKPPNCCHAEQQPPDYPKRLRSRSGSTVVPGVNPLLAAVVKCCETVPRIPRSGVSPSDPQAPLHCHHVEQQPPDYLKRLRSRSGRNAVSGVNPLSADHSSPKTSPLVIQEQVMVRCCETPPRVRSRSRLGKIDNKAIDNSKDVVGPSSSIKLPQCNNKVKSHCIKQHTLSPSPSCSPVTLGTSSPNSGSDCNSIVCLSPCHARRIKFSETPTPLQHSRPRHGRLHKLTSETSAHSSSNLTPKAQNVVPTTTCQGTQSKDQCSSNCQREVDPREVMARMDSAIVKTVLKMDIPKRLVEKAISKRLAENGKDFSTSEALLEAIFNLDLQEENTNVKEPIKDEPTDGIEEKEEVEQAQSAKEIEESMRLAEENRVLKEQRICKICMDEEVCMAFLPCGHLVCCATCAPALNSCPICRAKVRGTVRTYLS